MHIESSTCLSIGAPLYRPESLNDTPLPYSRLSAISYYAPKPEQRGATEQGSLSDGKRAGGMIVSVICDILRILGTCYVTPSRVDA